MDKPREAIFQILLKSFANHAYTNIALQVLSRPDFSRTDRAFATEIVYGTVSRKRSLEYIIGKYASIPIRKMSAQVYVLLLMGTYQIYYMDRVPVSAACNTSVDLAKVHCSKSSGFVNAILRSIVRGIDNLKWPDISEGNITSLGIYYSYPDWMIKSWIGSYGLDMTKLLMKAGNSHPPLSIRVNQTINSRDELLEILEEEGVSVSKGSASEDAIVLHSPENFSRLTSFIEGRFTIQDESAMLVAAIADPKPGDMVLDTCSAPGGKTTHLAERMKNTGSITAWDLHENKLSLIEESAARLKLSIITTKQQDASVFVEDELEKYDCVLVDAPCSGTGIIRRKPDIKWNRNPSDISALVEIQSKILYNAGRYVKQGGVLVYSTCSMEKEENEEVCERFLTEFHCECKETVVNKDSKSALYVLEGSYRHLYPTNDETDGFFIARFRRQ